MEKNQLIRCQGTIYRVLLVDEDSILVIDCIKKSMPKWYEVGWTEGYEDCTEEELLESTGMELTDEQDLGQKARRTIHERFTVIAGILPFIDDERIRVEAIKKISKERGISEQTVRNYLCQYLVYQSIGNETMIAPKKADLIVLLTGYMNHALYYKYIGLARDKGIKMTYCNGSNIDLITKQVACCL